MVTQRVWEELLLVGVLASGLKKSSSLFSPHLANRKGSGFMDESLGSVTNKLSDLKQVASLFQFSHL